MINKDSKGRFLPNNIANPTGKGGFKDNPENINFGGRPKNSQRFSYWLQFFKDMTSKEFNEYAKKRKVNDMYVAEIIAYERVKNSRTDLREYQDLADRTEGRPTNNTNITGDLTLVTLLEDLTGEDITQKLTEDN
jgi:hypothetical protein